ECRSISVDDLSVSVTLYVAPRPIRDRARKKRWVNDVERGGPGRRLHGQCRGDVPTPPPLAAWVVARAGAKVAIHPDLSWLGTVQDHQAGHLVCSSPAPVVGI